MADEETKPPTRGEIAKAKGLHPFVIEVPYDHVRQLDHLAVEQGTKRKPLVQHIIDEYLRDHNKFAE